MAANWKANSPPSGALRSDVLFGGGTGASSVGGEGLHPRYGVHSVLCSPSHCWPARDRGAEVHTDDLPSATWPFAFRARGDVAPRSSSTPRYANGGAAFLGRVPPVRRRAASSVRTTTPRRRPTTFRHSPHATGHDLLSCNVLRWYVGSGRSEWRSTGSVAACGTYRQARRFASSCPSGCQMVDDGREAQYAATGSQHGRRRCVCGFPHDQRRARVG